MRENDIVMSEKEGLLRFMYKDVPNIDINEWNETAAALDTCVVFEDNLDGRTVYVYPDALEA